MKRIILIVVSMVFTLVGCTDDVFELQPLDKISDVNVWNDQTLMRAYLTDVYSKMPFSNRWGEVTNERNTPIASWATTNRTSENLGTISRTNESRGFWRYDLIRELNIFIERVVDAAIPEFEKRQMEGEARVLRAMIYFEKQKRYGGVPLVDIPLDPYQEIDRKYLERSTEEAIADFIDADLDAAIPLLTEDRQPVGRINKWTAYAVKARANLWAASIAKYGNVQLNGVVGIPSARANELYTKALNAANTVITSGKYALYNQHDNKSENYRLLFMAENSESILMRLYDGVNLRHGWNIQHLPQTIAGGHGANLNPTYGYILAAENIDGSTSQPLIGPEYLYDYAYQAFENKDPRILANVVFDGDNIGGFIIRTYEGLDIGTVPNPDNILAEYELTYNGVPVVAEDSRLLPFDEKATSTGFLIKKYIDYNMLFQAYVGTPYHEFRLAEMYLIVAEAEFELGNMAQAAVALNATRERAGISLVSENTITLDHVRTERMSELAFESSYSWDLRRWRTAEDALNQLNVSGLRTILHYETGKIYYLPLENSEGFIRTFNQEMYYNPITDARRANQPEMIENPGY